jgi:hypothetical protein
MSRLPAMLWHRHLKQNRQSAFPAVTGLKECIGLFSPTESVGKDNSLQQITGKGTRRLP